MILRCFLMFSWAMMTKSPHDLSNIVSLAALLDDWHQSWRIRRIFWKWMLHRFSEVSDVDCVSIKSDPIFSCISRLQVLSSSKQTSLYRFSVQRHAPCGALKPFEVNVWLEQRGKHQIRALNLSSGHWHCCNTLQLRNLQDTSIKLIQIKPGSKVRFKALARVSDSCTASQCFLRYPHLERQCSCHVLSHESCVWSQVLSRSLNAHLGNLQKILRPITTRIAHA